MHAGGSCALNLVGLKLVDVMTAQLLDGNALAATIKQQLAEEITALNQRGITPGLGTILVGDDAPSATYVSLKHRDSAQIGIASFSEHLPASTSQAQLHEVIDRFNADP